MNMMWPPAPSDCGAVVTAAEALGIGEYDFFRLGFRRWSGHEPDGKALERTFAAYYVPPAGAALCPPFSAAKSCT